MSATIEREEPIMGFGNCINYRQELGVGLPIDVDKGRPLVIAHPAAGGYYHSSMNLFEDTEHPFLHVMVDFGGYYPDTYPYSMDSANHALFHRLPDSSLGHNVFRKASISTPHWQMHVIGEAYEFLSKAPPLDILYVDWFTWLDQFIVTSDNSFCDMISHYVHKIRDGGLIIIDDKHENIEPWNNYPKERTKITNDSEIEYLCHIEWMGTNWQDEMTAYSAKVLKVHHNLESKLGQKNWFDEIKEWFWTTIPEFALNKVQIEKMIENKQEESIHHLAVTWDDWHDTWRDVYMDLETPILQPIPPFKAWPRNSYIEYLKWLKEHPKLLFKKLQKRTFKLKDHNFKLTLVEGDIVQLSPYLYSNDAAIAVRDNLKNRIISRCSWWKNQATTLQSGKNWNFNPIKKLIWSGKDATPNLTQKLIEQSIKQPNMIIHSKMKSFECRRIITISHGKGNLKELMSSCQDLYYEINNHPYLSHGPLELVVVHKDPNDYQEAINKHWTRIDY
jgi:hypothetical protein